MSILLTNALSLLTIILVFRKVVSARLIVLLVGTMFLVKRRASLSCLANVYHNYTTAVHDGFQYKSKFRIEDEEKILNVLNKYNADQLSRFDVSQMRIKSLVARKNKRGPFMSLTEILEVDGLSVKNLERLCESIINNSESLENSHRIPTPTIKSRRNNFVLPVLDSDLIVNSAVGLHVDPTGISWVKLEKSNNNSISNWNYYDISNLPKRMLPNETFNLAMALLSNIPKGDVYVFESTSSINSIVQNQASTFPNMHNIELISMLLALINTDKRLNKQVNENVVYFLRSKLSSRLFRTLVGTERISSSNIIDNLLMQNDTLLPCTKIHADDMLKRYYYGQSSIHRDILGQSLLIALTFMDLCVYKNVKSLQALLDKKKQKC